MTTRPDSTEASRRLVLKTVGVISLTGITTLAGCTGDDGDNGSTGDEPDTLPGSDYPAVEDWMTETEIGGADERYDGDILDLRDETSVTIDVGASGNGNGYAFGPSAVATSTGTEFVWDWTGEGGAHNVEAIPDEQLGESDYEFTSGDAVQGADNEYSYTFDESGIALYHCEPHLNLGMKGSIVID